MKLEKSEILGVLRELYLDVDVPPQVRLKAAEACLEYVDKKEEPEEKPKDEESVGDAFKNLMEMLKDS